MSEVKIDEIPCIFPAREFRFSETGSLETASSCGESANHRFLSRGRAGWIPSYPAARASARQLSSGVSPPNSGKSSLLQPMGLMPSRTGIDHGSALFPPRSVYACGRRIGDGEAPPVIKLLRRGRNDDDA